MVKPIMKDIFFLGQKSEPATKADLQVGRDLMDTLAANRERCVGMAANMIGVKKRVIIVNLGFVDVVMFNPILVRKDSPYKTEEGCLSLPGIRKTTRYQTIEVEYLDRYTEPRMEDVIDEMIAILSDREEFRKKKEMERTQAAINEIYRNGL